MRPAYCPPSAQARKTPKEMLQRDEDYRSSSRGIRSRSRSRSPRRHRRRSGDRSTLVLTLSEV